MNESEQIVYDLATMAWADGETQPIDEPASVVRSFAAKANKPIDKVEALWNKLKASAEKKGFKGDRMYQYIVGVMKKILKIA